MRALVSEHVGETEQSARGQHIAEPATHTAHCRLLHTTETLLHKAEHDCIERNAVLLCCCPQYGYREPRTNESCGERTAAGERATLRGTSRDIFWVSILLSAEKARQRARGIAPQGIPRPALCCATELLPYSDRGAREQAPRRVRSCW